jgi:eukaryotic-like serine/threonine-protein kinase
VESLLAHYAQAGDFLEAPPSEMAAEILQPAHARLTENQRIGHYTIQALLGVGGMGEVYLAQDTRLDRRVALKLLPAQFTANEDRKQRFEQEARSASALNHPNIVTIHEIGQNEGTHFIVTEYIEGQTLHDE